MNRLRQILTWVVRGLLFVFIMLFAMKNTEPVALSFYFGQRWEVPLALLVFLTLAFGAVLGLLAGLELVFAQRREIARLNAEIGDRRAERDLAARRQPPAASGADFDPRTGFEP